MNITVSGNSYRVNVTSAYNPFCSCVNKDGVRKICGVLPQAPYSLWEEFRKVWDERLKDSAYNKKTNQNDKSWKVESSNTKSFYTVTRDASGDFSCTCKGFMFRKSCKHIDQLKDK